MIPFSLFLLLFAFAAGATEIPLGNPRVADGDSQLTRSEPVVAAGNGFLVLWQEFVFGTVPSGSSFRAYDANGVPQRPTATRLDGVITPHAIWTGRDWIVISAATFSRFGSSVPVDAIFVQRVLPDGTIESAARSTLAKAKIGAAILSVASVGSHYGALVQFDGDQHLIVFDDELHVVSDTVLGTIALSPYRAVAPKGTRDFLLLKREDGQAVAHHSFGYVSIEWSIETSAVTANLLNLNGEVTESFFVATGANPRSIARDGDGWITVFQNGTSGMCTARFTNASDVQVACSNDDARSPYVAANGQRSFRAWIDGAGQIVTDGGVASEVMVLQWAPAVALDANGRALAWIEDGDIHIGGFLRDGTPRAESVIDTNEAGTLDLAASGARSLVVWEEARKIYAQRVDLDGPIGTKIDLGFGYGATIASRGDGWIVAWSDGLNALDPAADVLSMRIDLSGTTSAVQSFAAPDTQQYDPSLAATSEGFVIVWREVQNILGVGAMGRIVAEPLDVNGNRISGGVRIVDGAGRTPNNPGIGCNVDSCLVAWWEGETRYGMLIRHDGTPLTPARFLVNRYLGESFINVAPDGSYRLFGYIIEIDVATNGEVTAVRPWTPHLDVVGGAVMEGDTAVLAYWRNGRVFLRELTPRRRAVR